MSNLPAPVNDEVLAAKMAALTVANPAISKASIAKQLSVGPNVVNRILNSEGYRALLANMTREQIAPILAKVKTDIYNLGVEAVRVLRERLAENDLEAAKVVLRTMAVDLPQENQGDTNITVVVPGAINEVIEVKK